MIQSLPSGSRQYVSNHLTTDTQFPSSKMGRRTFSTCRPGGNANVVAAYPNNRLRELEGPRTGPRAWGGQRLRRRRHLDRIRGRERRNLLPVLHWPSRRPANRGRLPRHSTDLVCFERRGRNPLIAPIAGHEAIDRRDPYVFYNDVERRWWMLIAARPHYGAKWRRGCIVLATSESLLDWDVEPDPFYVPGTAYWPERPELWMPAAGGISSSRAFPRPWGRSIG